MDCKELYAASFLPLWQSDGGMGMLQSNGGAGVLQSNGGVGVCRDWQIIGGKKVGIGENGVQRENKWESQAECCCMLT